MNAGEVTRESIDFSLRAVGAIATPARVHVTAVKLFFAETRTEARHCQACSMRAHCGEGVDNTPN